MDFDSYWQKLVDRVDCQKDTVRGPDELVYRLTCIYGETMVDGIESYFERRVEDYERDMAVLMENGFADVAADFGEARQVMFGNLPLNEASIAPVLERLLNEDISLKSEQRQIEVIYDRLIEKVPKLLDRRDEIGASNGLFTIDAEPTARPQIKKI